MHPQSDATEPFSGPVRKLLVFGDGPQLQYGFARHDPATIIPRHYYQQEAPPNHYSDAHGLYREHISSFPRADAILMFVLPPAADVSAIEHEHLVAQCEKLLSALIKYRTDYPRRAFDNAGLVVVAPDYDPCDTPDRYELPDAVRQLYQRIKPDRVTLHVGIYVAYDVSTGLRLVNLLMGKTTGDETSEHELSRHHQSPMTRR